MILYSSTYFSGIREMFKILYYHILALFISNLYMHHQEHQTIRSKERTLSLVKRKKILLLFLHEINKILIYYFKLFPFKFKVKYYIFSFS